MYDGIRIGLLLEVHDSLAGPRVVVPAEGVVFLLAAEVEGDRTPAIKVEGVAGAALVLEARNRNVRDLVGDDPLRSVFVDGLADVDGESRGESFLVVCIFKCVDEAVPVGTVYNIARETADAHTSTSLK